MRKYIFLLIIVFIIIVITVILIGCIYLEKQHEYIDLDIPNTNSAINDKQSNQNIEPIYESNSSIENVKMEIKEGSVTSTSVIIIITDTNKEPYGYGEWFKIEKKVNNEWIDLEPIDIYYTFNAIGWLVGKDGTIEEKEDWKDLYGELEEGEYRIVKEVNGSYIYAEFSI